MTTKKTTSQPAAAPKAAARPAHAFERQAPPAPRLQPVARAPQLSDPAEASAAGSASHAPGAPPRRSARDVILRLVETLKEL